MINVGSSAAALGGGVRKQVVVFIGAARAGADSKHLVEGGNG
jgi:hypothetical protein